MFWQRARRVCDTLLTATRSDGTAYAVVTYVDGGIGIARDGVPLEPFYWTEGEMDECVETFMRLSGFESGRVRFGTAAN